MSKRGNVSADELTLPIKRTEGETLADRLTGNAYHNILPARYLRKDSDGELVESQEDLFERVAKNVALAEAVFEARRRDVEITVTPDQLKPDHPRRDELASEVFGAGTSVEDNVETTLTEYNVNKFAYETIVPDLPAEIRDHVVTVAEDFQESMESLSFMPNSPTLMNAGDELQQLSACFVDSPEDDIDDIHQTAKEAAQVFQCLTADATVHVDGKGLVSIADVEPGDEIRQREGSDHRTQTVEETHAYQDAPVSAVETAAGLTITGTPNHELHVDGEWTRIDEIEAGDALSLRLGWLPETTERPALTTAATGGQWDQNRTVSNEEIRVEHARGLSDYEIAERLDCSASTVQRRRANELDLPPNGSGGPTGGDITLDPEEFTQLYERGHSDREIATELGVHASTVGQFRTRQALEPNGEPVKTVTQPTTLGPDLAELVGMWIGDGSVHEDGIRFHIRREETLEHLDYTCRTLFDEGLDWRWEDGCYDAVLHSHEVKRFWMANFGDAKPQASEARVPEPVREADVETVAAFLRGLFSTDGSLQKDRYPRLWTASAQLRDEVHQLLLGLGIPATDWELDADHREYYNVGPVGERGLTRFVEHVGFTDERSETMQATLAETDLEPVSVGQIQDSTWTVPVTGVTDAGTATVYDVTVADRPEYVANSVVSHNSGGGMGYAFWRLRPYGDAVGSTGGIASGPITFMRTYDQMCETIAQGGARRGAQMGVMRISHPDVIQFIHAKNKDVSLAETLRLNDPDDPTHTSFQDALAEARELIDDEGRVPEHLRNAVEGHLSNFNISVGITDRFMEALKNDEEYTFINPRTEEPHIATAETQELYEMFGLGEHVEVGEELSVPAATIWEHIIEGAHENGEPGVIYLERVNKEHSFDVEEHPDHRILATNPCVTGDTYIDIAGDDEAVQIEDLYTAKRSPDVWTLDDSGEQIRTTAEVYKTGEDEPIVRVTFDDDVALTVTPDHEIRTVRGDWVEAQDLTPGDRVETSVKTSTERNPIVADGGEAGLTVQSVEDAGTADVFDLNVPGTHNYFAATSPGSDSADVFVNVHNCGEQPLEEYEACNLGHINLSTLAAKNAPDWRVWSDRHADEYDSQAAAISAFMEAAIDWEAFDRRIELGTRFLENVVTMSDFPVEKIEAKVREMRKIGLGIMGLAQLYIQLGIEYGSEPANELARQLMTHINHGSKSMSHELAKERGSFAEWEHSKFANPTEYREWFEHQTGRSADDWADGFPIRNHNTTTIAPTGTTSMVGNTTGGCEPIYNVAYYKNVSDDVQGDEMLVEFDDYFLRVLEANDIDVETVKDEAIEQMAANGFDGVESLSTVPDTISELFVTTGDLSAKQHASVQTACQQGVDSAISKTVNAPNDSTVEDAKEVFEYIYDHGGKGVTYYRDGTRSKQVLTTRAQNTDFADMDEDEALTFVIEQIEEVFDGLEDFLDSEEVRNRLTVDIDELLSEETSPYAEKKPRPDQLHGVTQRIDTGYGKLYVTINEDPESNEPFELFANTGHSGGFTNSFTDALAKTISVALRSGVDPYEIVDKLQGIRSPKVAWDKGEQINSIPDAFGTALRRYLDDEIDMAYPDQATLEQTAAETETEMPPETDGAGTATPDTASIEADHQSVVDAGENPECPDCGSLSLYYAEGCKTCESCGWSEC